MNGMASSTKKIVHEKIRSLEKSLCQLRQIMSQPTQHFFIRTLARQIIINSKDVPSYERAFAATTAQKPYANMGLPNYMCITIVLNGAMHITLL